MILVLYACAPQVSDISATVSEVVPTVVTVTWTSDAETTGHVEFGGLSTPEESDAGTEHTAVLVGADPNSTIDYTIVDADGGVSDPQSVTNGGLVSTIPEMTITGDSAGLYIATSLLGSVQGPALLSPEGKVVWFYPFESDLLPYRARVARDGSGMLYNMADVSGDPSPDSALVWVSWDGTETQSWSVPLLAHDFVELDDGSLVAMAVEYRTGSDGSDVRGDQLVKVAPDGTQSQVWSAWDCFDPDVDIGTDQEYGWTFGNALDYDASSGHFYENLRNFSTIVEIDPTDRTCPWAFGSTSATVAPEGEVFLHNHQFELLDDEILVFDNEGAGDHSRVVDYSYDGGDTATAIGTYASSDDISTFVLGDVMRMDDGGMLVDWAVGGGMDRVDASGQATWTIRTTVGGAFGFFTPQATPWQ